MYKTFIKENTIKTLKVEKNKVFTTITLGDYIVTNPTLKQFLAAGWEEYNPEPELQPEHYVPTKEELVEQKLRERYSINQEFEVQRKRDTDPDSFQAYYDYVEECIEWAEEQLNNK